MTSKNANRSETSTFIFLLMYHKYQPFMYYGKYSLCPMGKPWENHRPNFRRFSVTSGAGWAAMADVPVPTFRPMFKKNWVGWDGVMALASKRLTAGTMKMKGK